MTRIRDTLMVIIFLGALLAPAVAADRNDNPGANLPSIGQQLMREGDLAIKLLQALSLGTTEDEVQAESLLSAAGIAPKNGWIADYPVTPDIVDELRGSVYAAASSGAIRLSTDQALHQLNQVLAQGGLAIDPAKPAVAAEPVTESDAAAASAAPSYPDEEVVEYYYQTEGPPTITYYTPPPAYDYLYGWVPYPFWSAGFWFPGFFILHDFHRPFLHHHAFHHRPVFISNHFRDTRADRFIRLDPIARGRGHNIDSTRFGQAGTRVTPGLTRGTVTPGLTRGAPGQTRVNSGVIRGIPGDTRVNSGVIRGVSGDTRINSGVTRGVSGERSVSGGFRSPAIRNNGNFGSNAGSITGSAPGGATLRGSGSRGAFTRGDMAPSMPAKWQRPEGSGGRSAGFTTIPSGSRGAQFPGARFTSGGSGMSAPAGGGRSFGRGNFGGSSGFSAPRGFSGGMSTRGGGGGGGGGFSGRRGR